VLAFAENKIEDGAIIKGVVTSNNKPIPGATVYIKNSTIGSSANIKGEFEFTVPMGEIIVVASAIGFRSNELKVYINSNESKEINFELEEDLFDLEQIVITGTKTFKKQTNSPVIVNVIDSKLLGDV